MAADRNRQLLAWYDEHRRSLPWRSTRDPWAILVSEVMSQQTQISRVVPAWETFMAHYPSPAALAGADRAELITIWAGLGYQRRAFNLQRAASMIADHGWPRSAEELETQPGVGPYTAAAVACFAFGEPVTAVDTNLKRILSRWTGAPLSGRALGEEARSLLGQDRPADWNQAIMDLGALVCRPRDPDCGSCPVAADCADPTVYEPPPRQTRYEGSVRQARAAVLRHLAAHGPSRAEALEGVSHDTARRAIDALVSEGLVTERSGSLELS